jgi:hypothetical protein
VWIMHNSQLCYLICDKGSTPLTQLITQVTLQNTSIKAIKGRDFNFARDWIESSKNCKGLK